MWAGKRPSGRPGGPDYRLPWLDCRDYSCTHGTGGRANSRVGVVGYFLNLDSLTYRDVYNV